MSWQILVWLDSGVCTQNPAHSFWISGQPLPLCARNLGLFAGFLLAAAVGPRWRFSWLWLAGLLPIVLDGANSITAGALYPTNNILRLGTGLLAGASLAALLASHVVPRRAAVAGAIAAGLLTLFTPYAAPAVLGTLGALALLATANRLARVMPLSLAWALALPELGSLALLKHAALIALR